MLSVFKYFDLRFYLKFALLYLALYCINMFVVSVASPTGVYSSFVDNYLNYPCIIGNCVLIGSKFLAYLTGFDTSIHFKDQMLLSESGRNAVQMFWPCYGLMLMSFWLAYINAQSISARKKLHWSLIGISTIFLFNCIRVSTLLMAMEKNWEIGSTLKTNNHDLFNYISYLGIFVLILLYHRKHKSLPEGYSDKRALA